MADIGESLRALLLADTDVTDEVGQRIIPGRLAQGETLPAITYRKISQRHYGDINGSKAGMAVARITVDCYATTRAAANALAETVRLSGILDWYGDTYGSDVRDVEIDTGQVDLEEENTEGSHEYRYIASTDYAIHFTETV